MSPRGGPQRRTFLRRFAAIVLLHAPPAHANDASIALVGGVPVAVDEPEVRMVSEDLRFRRVAAATVPVEADGTCADPLAYAADDGNCWSPAGWDAELTYVFENLGDARTLRIGLPFQIPPSDSQHTGPAGDEPVYGLRTWIDGTEAPVELLSQTLSGDGWMAERTYVVDVEFAAQQTRTLVHRYRAFAGGSSSGDMNFTYLLETGRGWAGTIGQVEIRFELDEATPCVVASLPHEIVDNTVVVELRDWEPDMNFEVRWLPRASATRGHNVYFHHVAEAELECANVEVDRREEVARRLELLYGARHEASDATYLRAPPPECLWADTFAAALYADSADGAASWLRDGVAAIRYREAPSALLPPAAAACVAVLRQPLRGADEPSSEAPPLDAPATE